MDTRTIIENSMKRLPPRLVSGIFRLIRPLPFVQRQMEKEYETLIHELEGTVKPYRERFAAYKSLPRVGRDRQEVLEEMEQIQSLEEPGWSDGFVSGAVYHGDHDHIRFLNQIYALNSQSNPLHTDVWPSSAKYESEIVSMTANMLGADRIDREREPESQVCGVVSSGGTESILLAMKTYRDWARVRKKIRRPEMIIPTTAHAAFDKASQYFGIKCIRVPVDPSGRADVTATRRAVTRKTVVIVGSAPSFPHGTMDPIEALSELAREKNIGFHTDACLGGFVLPWAEKLGYAVPPFDFRLPGVTSISADTHKYGYASKGTSVILYRNPDLRRFQYYKTTEWPGGLYCSPTFAGSRPGALSAACWAAMISIGEEGYMAATKKILETGRAIKGGIEEIPELDILGDPLWNIAFRSKDLDIYQIMDFMAKRKWSLNALHKPPAVHICVTLRHTRPGIPDRFVRDLKDAVGHAKKNPDKKEGMAPVYGMAAHLPVRGIVGDLLEKYLDLLYKV